MIAAKPPIELKRESEINSIKQSKRDNLESGLEIETNFSKTKQENMYKDTPEVKTYIGKLKKEIHHLRKQLRN